jgi:hypothetical protein
LAINENVDALYHFNTSTGLDTDSTSNGNDLTIVGATSTTGKLSEAIFFDGNDYGESPSLISTLANRTQGTLAMWFNFATINNQVNTLFSIDNASLVSGVTTMTLTIDLRSGLEALRMQLVENGTVQWRFQVDAGSFHTNYLNTPSTLIIKHDGSQVSEVIINNVSKSIDRTITTNETKWFKGVITDTAAPNKADLVSLGVRNLNGARVNFSDDVWLDELVLSGNVWDATEDAEYWNGGSGTEISFAVDTTTVGVATAVDNGTQGIDVSMPYTDDDNNDSTYTIDYKESSDSTWINHVTNASNTPSPYTDTITGLRGAVEYDVRCTYNDPDGVTGTNPQIISNVLVRAIPRARVSKYVRQDKTYKIVRNDSKYKIVKRTTTQKVVKS